MIKLLHGDCLELMKDIPDKDEVKVDIFNTDKKYSIIYADPPWAYNARNNKNTTFSLGVHGHYPVMPHKEICNLNVQDLANKDCALFLWVTFPRLKEGLEVIDAWGFNYKTVAFNWFKTNKDGKTPFFGVGFYTKSNTEICLLGIKGRMKPISNYISEVVIADELPNIAVVAKREKHSKKPDIIRDKIVELFGDLPRIELFARQGTEGWDCWGNEV